MGADIGYDRAIKILREAEEDVTRSNPPRLYEVCVYDAEHAGYGHSPCVGNVTLLPHAGRDAVETALNIVHVYAPRGADQLVWSKSGLVAFIYASGEPIVSMVAEHSASEEMKVVRELRKMKGER